MIKVNGKEIASFVYDGDGNRIKKLEGGQETVYINRYFEKNITTGNATSSYYLGGRLVAVKEGYELRYVQDHLTGTSVMSDSEGSLISSIKYLPFGGTLSGSVPTDRLFTGQRLDSGTGLYYYGARYYDPAIGRFISADTIVPNPANPQSFNRYTYCLNNPLKYIDPSGHAGWKPDFTKDDPWEGVPPDYKGYVPPGHERGGGDESYLPIDDDDSSLPVVVTTVLVIPAGELIVDLGIGILLNPLGLGFIGGLAALGTYGNIQLGASSAYDDTEKAILFCGPGAGYVYMKSEEGKLIEDLQVNPENWEKTGEESEPATGLKYKGGTSVEETYQNKQTGQEIEHHIIYDPSGKVVHDHFRVK